MRPGTPRRPPLTAGLYYTTAGLGTSAASPTLNRLRVVPFDNHRPLRFDRIAAYATLAAAGSTLRWAVYDDNGQSYPGALLLDTGAVGDAATVGLKEAVVDLPLAGRRYWLGCVVQGADCTLRLHSGNTAPGAGMTAADMAFGSNSVGVFTSGITGAVPAVFPTIGGGASTSSLGPQVWLRAA